MKKVAIVFDRENGVSYHRLQCWSYFANQLEKLEVVVINGFDPEHYDKIKGCSAIVFNRILNATNYKESIQFLQDKGIKVICDVDDYWKLHQGHILEHVYAKTKTPAKTEECIALSDEVWTTHDYLAKKIRKHNSNVLVIPNAINPFEIQWKNHNRHTYSFGWIGSAAHKVDLELLKRPMKKYWNDDTLNWKFIIGGFSVDKTWYDFETIVTGNRIAPKDRYVRANGQPVSNYGTLYDNVHVGLVPLADNDFNKCKSELKVLEFAQKGSTVIVSDIHPYSNVCTEDNSYLCKEPMDFYRHMKRVEKRPDEADKKAARLLEDVKRRYNFMELLNLRLQQLDK